MKKLWPVLALTALLAACGGGTEETEATPVATTPAIPPAPPADATLTQIGLDSVATPGESLRVAVLKVTCPLVEGTQSCKKQVPLGEIGFTADIELQDVHLVHDGNPMQGFMQHEGNLYRFSPTGYDAVWQTGTIEVLATVSPTAASGATTTVVVQAADDSFDKTLEVVSNKSSLEILALLYYAPAAIAVDTYVDANTKGFTYSCPVTVYNGCRIESFGMNVNAPAGTEVRLYVDGNWYVQMWTDGNGYAFTSVGANAWVPPGGSASVKAVARTPSGSAWITFQDFVSWSGNKQIAPKLPLDCVVNWMACKG